MTCDGPALPRRIIITKQHVFSFFDVSCFFSYYSVVFLFRLSTRNALHRICTSARELSYQTLMSTYLLSLLSLLYNLYIFVVLYIICYYYTCYRVYLQLYTYVYQTYIQYILYIHTYNIYDIQYIYIYIYIYIHNISYI